MTTIQINPNELSNKRVLVTGGTKGMGGAIVKRLLQAYATVRASYINGTEYVINGGTIPTV
jgi:NAD(P)-dependent dehydrogenase (short-subunit alcohol dehydrogenase family)